MSNNVDSGVKFAKENLENALLAARSNPDFSYLSKTIVNEIRRIKDIEKTGDLIEYFDGFASGTHQHAKEFYELCIASERSFYPNEKMSDVLRNKFPSEANNRTEINDFIIGKKYSNDFLSIVLGGSYALSFRNSRRQGIAYIVMNSSTVSPGTNEWKNNYNQLLFSPPGKISSDFERAERLVTRYKEKKVLVFDKLSPFGFTYLGIYRIVRSVDGHVLLERNEDINANIESLFCDEIKSFESNFSNEMDPLFVAADILAQKAIENGVSFSATKISKDGRRYVTFYFPYGFFELVSNFNPFELHIFNETIFRFRPLTARFKNRFFLSLKRFRSEDKELGWNILEDKLIDYSQKYYKSFFDGSFETTWQSDDQTILKKSKNIKYLSRFLTESIKADVKLYLENPTFIDASFERREEYDLKIDGYYQRIGVENPIFIFTSAFTAKYLEQLLSSPYYLGRIVVVAFNREKNSVERIKDTEVIVLGLSFVTQMARIYPQIYFQFIVPEDYEKEKETTDNPLLEDKKESLIQDKTYTQASKRNVLLFQEQFNSNKKINIITGNGVSIPFGSESWNELSKNLLNQLAPRFIESSDEVDEFFGKLSFFITDFSYDTLLLKKEDDLYLKSLKHSIYRRFSKSIFEEKTTIKSISEIKHTYNDSVTLFTYNYDTFLEDQYQHDYSPNLLKPVITPTGLDNEVVHLHGILKEDDLTLGGDIVLTRSKYYEVYTDISKHKGLSLLFQTLKKETCLFVGSSMTDIFQMMMIDRATKENNDGLIFAVLPIDKLNEGAKETIYQYFLRKHILIIPFKEFSELPRLLLELFNIK